MFHFCSTSVSGFIQCCNLWHWVAFYQHDRPAFDFSASFVHWDDLFGRFLSFRTVLLLIRIILEYCQCVDNIPSITTDMLTRLSDLLKVWLQMCPLCQAGAGRVQRTSYSPWHSCVFVISYKLYKLSRNHCVYYCAIRKPFKPKALKM